MMAQGGSTVWAGEDESAKWSGKETEESASEEDSETPGGAGNIGMTLTATEEESERSGAEDGPGGAVDGGVATSDTTSKDVNAARAGDCHGVEKGNGRGLPASGKTQPASPI